MKNKGLSTPIIPVAMEDGLIKLEDSQTTIAVLLETWEYSHAGDTYQLMINGKLTGPAQSLPCPAPEVGSPLTLAITPENIVHDGVYQVAYQATNVLGMV